MMKEDENGKFSFENILTKVPNQEYADSVRKYYKWFVDFLNNHPDRRISKVDFIGQLGEKIEGVVPPQPAFAPGTAAFVDDEADDEDDGSDDYLD